MSEVLQGDCLVKLKEIAGNSVDAIITDPPYELGFMGKKWDNSGIAYNVEMLLISSSFVPNAPSDTNICPTVANHISFSSSFPFLSMISPLYCSV